LKRLCAAADILSTFAVALYLKSDMASRFPHEADEAEKYTGSGWRRRSEGSGRLLLQQVFHLAP
jgi:hypothetical protein